MIFSYGIRLIPRVTLVMVLLDFPCLKIRFMLFQTFRSNIDEMIVKKKTKTPYVLIDNVSMYGMDRNKKIEIAQNKYFPHDRMSMW